MTLYDSTVAADIPATAHFAAGYVDGHFPDYAAIRARLAPDAEVLRITATGTHPADVGDIENGDLTPQTGVGWYRAELAAGHPTFLYTSYDEWPQVEAVVAAAWVHRPLYWIAKYDGVASIPADWLARGCVAKQYQSDARLNLDYSVLAPTFPGLDPPAPPAASDLLEVIMSLAHSDDDAHDGFVRLIYALFVNREPTPDEWGNGKQTIAQNGLGAFMESVIDGPAAPVLAARRAVQGG